MILFAVILALAVTEPIHCEQVRVQVAQHGKIKAYAWALANGYTPKEISRIRKQCGV
jgi:hypothetical protein